MRGFSLIVYFFVIDAVLIFEVARVCKKVGGLQWVVCSFLANFLLPAGLAPSKSPPVGETFDSPLG